MAAHTETLPERWDSSPSSTLIAVPKSHPRTTFHRFHTWGCHHRWIHRCWSGKISRKLSAEHHIAWSGRYTGLDRTERPVWLSPLHQEP